MAIIDINDLSLAFEKLIEKRAIGIVNIYNKELISLNKIVKNIARTFGKKVMIITVPINITLMFFGIFKKILNLLNIENKFSVDSLAGYKLYKNLKLSPTDLDSLLKDQ